MKRIIAWIQVEAGSMNIIIASAEIGLLKNISCVNGSWNCESVLQCKCRLDWWNYFVSFYYCKYHCSSRSWIDSTMQKLPLCTKTTCSSSICLCVKLRIEANGWSTRARCPSCVTVLTMNWISSALLSESSMERWSLVRTVRDPIHTWRGRFTEILGSWSLLGRTVTWIDRGWLWALGLPLRRATNENLKTIKTVMSLLLPWMFFFSISKFPQLEACFLNSNIQLMSSLLKLTPVWPHIRESAEDTCMRLRAESGRRRMMAIFVKLGK